MVQLDHAAEFIWLNARLIDRHRFEYHFRGGDREPVLAALRPYQNPDGGFGNALEPDLRGPGSQPASVDLALTVLDEIKAMDDVMVSAALGFLEVITRPDGGVPFVLPAARDYPRAEWWQVADEPPGALVTTAAIVGQLQKNGVQHPWIERATEFCWHQIDASDGTSPYEARAVIHFLDQVPDRSRAERAWEQVGGQLLAGGHIALDPQAKGEVRFPLDYARTPESLARRLFSDDVIDQHLDALTARQQPDGGWALGFESWTPITEPEWRGWVVLENLLILRAYGRL